jgi:hypothetical protein
MAIFELTEGSDAGKPFKTHGSDDVGGLGESYPVAARNLAELWQKGREPKGALKPWQNAENLAASTLGKNCRSREGFGADLINRIVHDGPLQGG